MSHHSYAEKRKDLRPWIDMICDWAEFSFVIGGIAFHKVDDLETRLAKMIPEPSQAKKDALRNLHDAWRLLREITDEVDVEKRQRIVDRAREYMKGV